jgi:hypothetical protein
MFPLSMNRWTRNLYINITAPDSNGDEQLTLRVDCHRHLMIDSRFFDGARGVNFESLFITSSDDRNIEIQGYLVDHSSWVEEGYLGIGPGSIVIRQHGPVDVIYWSDMETRFLVLNSSDVYPQSCLSNSTISIPFVYVVAWAHHVIPNVKFNLLGNTDSVIPRSYLDELLLPQPVSLNGFSLYMCLPSIIARTLSDIIITQGALWVLSDDMGVPISFIYCTSSIINSLPDIVIEISGDSNNTLGSVIQTPSDYLRIDHSNEECTFRFVTAYEDEIYSINPFVLNGINVRMEQNQLKLCDSIVG